VNDCVLVGKPTPEFDKQRVNESSRGNKVNRVDSYRNGLSNEIDNRFDRSGVVLELGVLVLQQQNDSIR